MRFKSVDWSIFALAAFVLLLLIIFSRGYMGVISDGRDYYVQARSIVIDHDLDITENELQMGAARGDARLYPIGTALLWTPFLLVCHLVIKLSGNGVYAGDGYDAPYMWTVGFATLIYGALSLVMIARVVATYFSVRLAVFSTIVMCAASFLIWYIAVDAAASHGASVFAVTLFLYIWHQTRDERSGRAWLALGAAAGLMSIVRWQDIVFALVLVPGIVKSYWQLMRQWSSKTFATLLRHHASGAAAAALLIVPQLWLWHRSETDSIALPIMYRVRWFEVDPTNVLFSANHGLLVWTPILYMALIGLVVFFRREPRVALALISGLLIQVYVNSTLQVWWGGSGFGARRFSSCALAFTIGLAAFITWVRERPMALVSAVMAAIVGVNVALMLDIHAGRLPIGEGLTAGELLGPAYSRIGNPFSAPANLVYSWMHGVSPAQYDALGNRVFASLFIDVGEADDSVFLSRGWWAPEQSGDITFRWAVGGTSEVAMPLRERDEFILRFRAEPFAPAGWDSLAVTLVVNGNRVDQLTMEPGWRDYAITVPRDAVRRNLNIVRFQFSRALSPAAASVSVDPRELTARFDRIAMVRIRRSAPAADPYQESPLPDDQEGRDGQEVQGR
jgi:hypothetical protein